METFELSNRPCFFTLKGFFFSNKTCGSGNLRESNKCQKIWVVTLQDQTNPAIVHSYPMNIPWISQSYSTIKKPGSHWSFCQAFFCVTSTVLTHTRDADRFESLPSKVGNMLDVEMTLIWPGYRCSDITTVGMAFIQNHLVLFHDFYASLGWQKKTALLQCQDAARLTTVLRKWVVGHHPCEMLGTLDCTRKWEWLLVMTNIYYQ